MNKKLGILGLMAMAAVTLITPATASAQDRYNYQPGYAPVYQDHDYRVDNRWRRDEWREREFREAREREIIRQREWRERERCERGYVPYYGPHY